LIIAFDKTLFLCTHMVVKRYKVIHDVEHYTFTRNKKANCYTVKNGYRLCICYLYIFV